MKYEQLKIILNRFQEGKATEQELLDFCRCARTEIAEQDSNFSIDDLKCKALLVLFEDLGGSSIKQAVNSCQQIMQGNQNYAFSTWLSIDFNSEEENIKKLYNIFLEYKECAFISPEQFDEIYKFSEEISNMPDGFKKIFCEKIFNIFEGLPIGKTGEYDYNIMTPYACERLNSKHIVA